APRLRLVEPREGEADVDQHVLADPHVGDVLQAGALHDAAEVDLAHEHVMLAVGLHHFPGHAEAHAMLLFRRAEPRERPGYVPRPLTRLGSPLNRAAAMASWPRLSPPSLGGTR